MDEFIKSIDVSKDALKASDSSAAPLPAAPGPTSTSNFLVRGVDAGFSETSAQPLDRMKVPPTRCLQPLDESQPEKADELFEPVKIPLLKALLTQIDATVRPCRLSSFSTPIASRKSNANIVVNVQGKKGCRFPIATSAMIPRLIITADAAR